MSISVIIPTLNEAGQIEATLASVLCQAGDFEVILVDGGSTDGTLDRIPPPVRVLTSPRAGRAVQMNAGAHRAAGETLLFLHGDTRLHPLALEGIRRALRDPRVAGGTFHLRFDRRHWLLDAYAAVTRSAFLYFHYGDQGIFVRRPAFDCLGGFADLPLMEDIDFLRRLRRTGRLVHLPLPVTTSARRFFQNGLLRQQILNVSLVSLYLLGVSPTRLAVWYREKNLTTEPTESTEKRDERE